MRQKPSDFDYRETGTSYGRKNTWQVNSTVGDLASKVDTKTTTEVGAHKIDSKPSLDNE